MLNLHPWLTKSNPWPWHLQLRQLFLKLLCASVQPLGTSKLDHGSFLLTQSHAGSNSWQRICNIVGDWIFVVVLLYNLPGPPKGFPLAWWIWKIYPVEPSLNKKGPQNNKPPNQTTTSQRCFQHQLENLAWKNWKILEVFHKIRMKRLKRSEILEDTT